MQSTRLANGIRVLSERLPDLTSITVGIWVENGSRYEQPHQAGISQTGQGLTREDFLRCLDARYRPDRVLIAAAGNLGHQDLVAVVEGKFNALTGTAPLVDGGPPEAHAGVSVHEKPLEQVHLCLGTPGIAQGDAERYPAHLLNLARGGGMSSRLFQEIRERRGKAYTVYSFLSSY